MIIEKQKHGTQNSYNKGCRCDKCKKAKKDYRKNTPIKKHGTKWSYDKGCRCKLCKNAKSLYWHKQNPNSKPKDTTNIKNNTRRCSICKKVKSLDEFGNDKNRLLNKLYECKGCASKRKRNSPKQRFTDYRLNAKYRNIEFNLSFEEFESFWNKPCYYCGKNIEGIGLDRIDSNDGYNTSNIVPCCSRCNKSKLKLKREEFIDMCIKVSNNFRNHIVDPNTD